MSSATGVMGVKGMVISTYSYPTQLEAYIKKRLAGLDLEDYKPTIQVESKGTATFFSCLFPEEMPKIKQEIYFKAYLVMPLAKAAVDLIQNEFAIEYGNQIIQSDYGFKEVVITKVVENSLERKKLLDPIIEAMMGDKNFCLDGWIRFRLAGYKAYMMDRVDRAIGDYQSYKEYGDFISLLKEFTLNQRSLVDHVHIIASRSGKINLYSKQYEKLAGIGEGEHDDLILGTLLTLGPSNITIHKKDKYNNIRLIETICIIYQDKIILCKGCKHCKKSGPRKRVIQAIKDILTQKKQ